MPGHKKTKYMKKGGLVKKMKKTKDINSIDVDEVLSLI